jgi:hypothetical protein
MPMHVQRGLALTGFGLLVGFVGLAWMLNLFGVVDEHARRIADNRWNRRWLRHARTGQEVRAGTGFQLGRYLAGGGFILLGVLAVGGGVAYLVAGPIE